MCFGETRPIINEFTVTRSAAFGQNITQSPHGVSCWHYYNCDMRRSEIEYNFVWFAFCNQNDGTVIFVGFMAGSKLVGSICSRFLRLLGPARDGLFSFSSPFLHFWCLLSRVRCLCRPTLFRSVFFFFTQWVKKFEFFLHLAKIFTPGVNFFRWIFKENR